MLSPLAHIDPAAKIGSNVTIYPFAYIEANTVIGDNCVIYPYVSIMAGTTLGTDNTVHQGTVLGAVPQDFSYTGEATELVIGNHNIIRENVVINRATHSGDRTVIGNGNCIMEGVHISHDAHIFNNTVVGYGTKIAGSVEIHDDAILTSNVIANPGARVGRCAMIKSGCRFSHDVPPFIIATHNPIEYGGVNSTILTNAGINEDVQLQIANAYRLVFNGKTSLEDGILQVRSQVEASPEIDSIVTFLQTSRLGIIGK